jgi:hypothetical protein
MAQNARPGYRGFCEASVLAKEMRHSVERQSRDFNVAERPIHVQKKPCRHRGGDVAMHCIHSALAIAESDALYKGSGSRNGHIIDAVPSGYPVS